MIIVLNSQGGLVAQQNENLFQGSNSANTIDIIAPFASNVTFRANFEMPDGTYMPEDKSGYILDKSINVINNLNVWKLNVNFPITQNYGIVKMQLRASVGSQIICTTEIKLPIQKGVPYASEYIEQDTYDAILAMINDLQAQLDNKVDIVKYTYKENQNVNEDTVGIYYTYNAVTDTYTSVVLPDNYVSGTTYYNIKTTTRFVGNQNGITLDYINDNNRVKLVIDNEKVTINDKKVVVFDDLLAENVIYSGNVSGLSATNVKNAIDELKFKINEIGNSQVTDLGERTLLSENWYLDNGIYKYDIIDTLFNDSLVQSLIVTPDKTAIDNLNENDILLYPEIDIIQQSDNIAVGILKADKKPNFNILANVKIQGTIIGSNTEGILAGQIRFNSTTDIPETNVQNAIERVQSNLNNFNIVYNKEKTSFATLDSNGKVYANQLPSYIDDVIEGYLYNAQFYLTKVDSTYTNLVIPQDGKIYIDKDTNKEYRWSGTQYSIISESLALGETNSTAYAGNKGKQNADDIKGIINGTITVANATNATNSTNATSVNDIQTLNDRTLVAGDTVIPYKKILWTGETRTTYSDTNDKQSCVVTLNLDNNSFNKKFIIEGIYEARNGSQGAILSHTCFQTPPISTCWNSDKSSQIANAICTLPLIGRYGGDYKTYDFTIELFAGSGGFPIYVSCSSMTNFDNFYTFLITKVYEVIE